MKQDFLKDLYYGHYRPFERRPHKSPEHAAVDKQIDREREYFATRLSPDDYKRFLDLEDLFSRSSSFNNINIFAYGLRFGAKFMDAILAEEESPTDEKEIPLSSPDN